MDIKKSVERNSFIVALILYLLALFGLAYTTNANIFAVFIGLLPVLLYIAVFFHFVRIDYTMALLWFLPLLFPLIFLFIWYSKVFPLINSMDGPVLAVLAILVSYVINAIVIAIYYHSMRPLREVEKKKYESQLRNYSSELKDLHSKLQDTTSKLDEKESALETTKSVLSQREQELNSTKTKLSSISKELLVTKENFNVNLRSIEDKCKAINFVIGRIYSDKRGASPEIREKLNISKELYNEFSDLTVDFKEDDAAKLLVILNRIHEKLVQMEMPENKVFKLNEMQIPILRDPNGNDVILLVMVKNDKDPVADYHAEAKEICLKLIKYLDEEYFKGK